MGWRLRKEVGGREEEKERERKKGGKDRGSKFGYMHLNKRDTYLSNYKYSYRKPKFKNALLLCNAVHRLQ